MAVFSESKMNTGRKILISETCHNARIPFQVHLWTLTQLTITFLKSIPNVHVLVTEVSINALADHRFLPSPVRQHRTAFECMGFDSLWGTQTFSLGYALIVSFVFRQ